MNTKLMLALTFLLAATSCKDPDVIVEQSNVTSGITIDGVRQVSLTPDEELHKGQSSFENMLIDQIVYRDSVYVLNMSREEALDLTIPDSLYVFYQEIVANLNTQQ